jgi:DNA primase catalytic core
MVATPISSILQRQQGQQETLSRCLEDAINSLSAEQIYNHPAHNFKLSGDRLRGGCPLHQSHSGSSFVVTISSKLFWCAGCQIGGGPADYRASLKAGRWVKARGKDFVETVRELAADANVQFPVRESSPEEIAKAQKWERRRAVLAETQNYCQEMLWSERVEALEARHYLICERGLTEEEIKLLPIGYYPSAGELKRHLTSKGFSNEDWKGTGCVWKDMERYITFLWNDASGRPLTIYGRYFKQFPPEGKPKTLATPGAKTKQSPLYFDRALKAGHKEIILVEGVLDAVLLQAKGDTSVCAYVAASCSGDQISALKRRGITKITLCGDPDHGGVIGTSSNLLRLTEAGIGVYIAPKLPDGLDPDEFLLAQGMEGWKAHINSAAHGFRWKAQQLIESGDITSDQGKAEVLHSAIAFCKAVKNHPELDIFFWPVIRSSLGGESEEFRTQLERLWESSPAEVADFGGSGGDGGDGGNGGYSGDKVVLHPSFNPIPPEQLEARLDALIQEGLSSAKLTHRLNQLAEETGRHVVELRKQYSERLSEIEREEGREDTQSQVDALIDASLASVNLREVLPRSLAEPLLKLAGWLNLKPECYLTALLTTTSILHKAGTKVLLNKEWDFEVTPNLYSAIIAPSSQKKSPIIKAICTKPLKVLQRETLEEYKHQLQIYQEELKEWEATKPEERGQPPVEPERKIYFFTKTTGEGLTYQAARCPEQGMLYLSDELAGMLNAQNQYRGGKGSDKQDLLSNYDGTGDVVLRAEGVKSEVDFVLLGILGGIQPKVMQKLLGTCDDPDGGWARFTFVNQPVSPSNMSADGGKYDLTELLTNLYRRIDALPPTEYRLSPKAFRLFCKAYNRLEELRVGARLEGMQSVWGKSEGRIGKLAVNLHVIHALMNGKIPSEEISVEMVRIAINLTKFYAQQVQSLYTQFSDPDALAPQLVKVIELSHKKDWLKASDFYLSITKAHRPSGETVREWFGELVAMGKGEVKGQGRSLQFRAFLPNELPPTPPHHQEIRQIRQELDNLSNAEMTASQEFQEKLDKLDKLDNFLKPDEVPQNVPIQDEAPYVLDSQGEQIQESFNSSNLSNSSNESHKQDTVDDTGLDALSNPVSNLSKVDALAPSPAPPGEPDAPTVEELADDPWMSEENLAEIVKDLADINLCDNRETLAMLCEIGKPHVMKAACKRLTPERQAQIMQWVLELNCQGKMYRYTGSDYSIQRLCLAHPLTVESIKGEIAIVSSPNWSEGITNEIPFAALKKLE